MIQSTNPASRSGMMVLMPRPAGVMAPVRLMPTVTSAASIRSVKSTHPSRSRPALYARNALSIRSATVSVPVMAAGSMRRPRRWLAEGRVISARDGPALGLLPRGDDDPRRLGGLVGDPEEAQVGGVDLVFRGDGAVQPLDQGGPVRRAEEHHRMDRHLAGLHQGQVLEQLVHRSVPARERDHGAGVARQHHLADEEEPEEDAAPHPGVGALLVGELDVDADREPAPLHRALVGGLHDARSAAGDDGESLAGEEPRGFGGLGIERVLGRGPGGADERHRVGHIAQALEPLDELPHDPEDPPRVATPEILDPLRRGPGAGEDFVLGGAGGRSAVNQRTVGHAGEYSVGPSLYLERMLAIGHRLSADRRPIAAMAVHASPGSHGPHRVELLVVPRAPPRRPGAGEPAPGRGPRPDGLGVPASRVVAEVALAPAPRPRVSPLAHVHRVRRRGRGASRRGRGRLRTVAPGDDAAVTPRVVIVGAGVAGLYLARDLGRAPVQVTVVDRTNHHLFQPMLYQVATAALSAPEIASPIRSVLRGHPNTDTILGEVVEVDLEARSIGLADGARLAYDYLVLAPGARHSYFQHPEWEALAPGLKNLEDAAEIRRRILLAFERAEREPDAVARHRHLTFVIVGGGPTGVEVAGAIAEVAGDGI